MKLYTPLGHPTGVILSLTQTESLFGKADLQDVFKVAPALRTGAVSLDVGGLWLLFPGQFVLQKMQMLSSTAVLCHLLAF